jgi:hypothetical protein
MKTSILAFVFVLFACTGFANGDNTENYIITKNDTIFCDNLQVGIFKTKLTMDDNLKLSIDNKEIVSYMKDGVRHELKSSIVNNKATNKKEFMQVVMQKHNFKIMMGIDYQNSGTARFYVFDNEKYICTITESNKANILNFFETI